MYIAVFEVHKCMDTNIINTRDSIGVSTPIYVHTDPQLWAPDELWAPLSKENYISFMDVTSNATFEYGREHKLKVNGRIVYKFKNDSNNYWAGVDYWPKWSLVGEDGQPFARPTQCQAPPPPPPPSPPGKRIYSPSPPSPPNSDENSFKQFTASSEYYLNTISQRLVSIEKSVERLHTSFEACTDSIHEFAGHFDDLMYSDYSYSYYYMPSD